MLFDMLRALRFAVAYMLYFYISRVFTLSEPFAIE
jgi:hypothetical protein